MKVSYCGYEINVSRERAMGGWDNLYYSIYRASDQREMVCNFTTGDDTVRDYVRYMKERIDAEHATPDPWDERAEELHWNWPLITDDILVPDFYERMTAVGYIEEYEPYDPLDGRYRLTEEGRAAIERFKI